MQKISKSSILRLLRIKVKLTIKENGLKIYNVGVFYHYGDHYCYGLVHYSVINGLFIENSDEIVQNWGHKT